jgi:hypothetical protein
MRVFNDGTTTYNHVFPYPPTGTQLFDSTFGSLLINYLNLKYFFANVGKYYLVESGYPNRLGYLAPYKGTKYHIQEYRDAPEPQGKDETSIMHIHILGMSLKGHLEF